MVQLRRDKANTSPNYEILSTNMLKKYQYLLFSSQREGSDYVTRHGVM